MMISSKRIFYKHLVQAIIEFGVAMAVLLAISIVMKNDLVGSTPIVAGLLAAAFAGSLHTAVKEAYNQGQEETQSLASSMK
jgi:hypothetical protein